MNILAIDTSTYVMGIAVMKNDTLSGEIITNVKKNHSVRLMPSLDYLMKDIDIEPQTVDQVVVAKGPGSYTGVRIGLSTAKSLAWALNIPIKGVSTLKTLAYQMRDTPHFICPFIDARREAVYTGLYKWEDNQMIQVIEDQYVSLEKWLSGLKEQNRSVTFVSPDLANHKEKILHTLNDLAYIPEAPYHVPRPSDLILASMNQEVDNVHTLTPKYLRLAEAEANWLKRQKEVNNENDELSHKRNENGRY